MIALVGPSGAGKSTITHLVARLYDVDSGAVRVGGHDVRDVTLQSLEDVVGYVTQDAHMFHDTIGANLRYARPGATDEQIWDALEAAQVARARRGPCPTASTPSSATAATASPAASASGWPSPGCCSRRRRSSCSTRRPPTSTPSPRPPSSAPSTRRSRAAPRWSSPTGSRRCATPTRSWSSTAAGSSSSAPTPSCSTAGGLYADLYRTQFFTEDAPVARPTGRDHSRSVSGAGTARARWSAGP